MFLKVQRLHFCMIFDMLFMFFLRVLSEWEFCTILADFEPQLELLWEPFFKQVADFEGKVGAENEVRTNTKFFLFWGRGRRQWRGPWKHANLQKSEQKSNTPCSPCGGAANPKASPLPPAPLVIAT